MYTVNNGDNRGISCVERPARMNADLLRRIIRAISGGSQDDLRRLALKIVEQQRKIGHARLADELESILLRTSRPKPLGPVLDSERHVTELPMSRRHGESLATVFTRESLEHHMVLPAETEQRFARIEAEYAAKDRLSAHGLRSRKTVLLYGPPGCGKSLGAKRLAWNTGLPLMKVRFDALISSFFGESATNLRTLFMAAREFPCVLLLDECDFIARSRLNSQDIGEASRLVNALLQLMEEYDPPGLLVATTNVEKSLDAALFRRFDDVFLVPPPGPVEIELLLRLTLSAVRVDDDLHWDRVVQAFVGSASAAVVKAAQDAAKAAVLGGSRCVTEAHLAASVAELNWNSGSTAGA